MKKSNVVAASLYITLFIQRYICVVIIFFFLPSRDDLEYYVNFIFSHFSS